MGSGDLDGERRRRYRRSLSAFAALCTVSRGSCVDQAIRAGVGSSISEP